MKYNESKGDLFNLEVKYALAHCVSQDCNDPKSWGMGIAKLFKSKFKSMKSYCARVIKENNLKYPCVIPYCVYDGVIFNLISKEVYYSKPTYATITKCIHEMAVMCEQLKIKYLGMPKIGCGLDKLQWSKVREIIKEEFKDMDIEIEIKYLQ